MSDFYPGQRVLCIDGKFAADVWEWTNQVPLEGEVYTVSEVVHCPHRLTGQHGGGLRLVEIDTAMRGSRNTPRLNWDVARFVPLDIKQTSTASRKKKGRLKKKKASAPRRHPEPVPA
jgi:hypothetical protein